MFTKFIILFLCIFSLSPASALTELIKDQVKDQVVDKAKEVVLGKKEGDKEEDKYKLRPDFFVSYGYSKRKAPVITISSGGDVKYNDPTFQRLSFLKKFEKSYFGLSVDYDSNTNKLSSLLGEFWGENWIVVLETAKLDGKITTSSGAVIPFSGNKYYDVKFLKFKQNKADPSKAVSLGIQYFQYERASVVNKDNTVYYDPKMKTSFLGVTLEIDNVKMRILRGVKHQAHDWYFYNTTSWGFGSVKFSDQSRTSSTNYAKPKDDSYFGVGMMGEYELGYVYSYNKDDFFGALKMGYMAQLENPYVSFQSTKSTDHPPKETFFTHGPQVTLIAAF